jgi:hypothetical protein
MPKWQFCFNASAAPSNVPFVAWGGQYRFAKVWLPMQFPNRTCAIRKKEYNACQFCFPVFGQYHHSTFMPRHTGGNNTYWNGCASAGSTIPGGEFFQSG